MLDVCIWIDVDVANLNSIRILIKCCYWLFHQSFFFFFFCYCVVFFLLYLCCCLVCCCFNLNLDKWPTQINKWNYGPTQIQTTPQINKQYCINISNYITNTCPTTSLQIFSTNITFSNTWYSTWTNLLQENTKQQWGSSSCFPSSLTVSRTF